MSRWNFLSTFRWMTAFFVVRRISQNFKQLISCCQVSPQVSVL
jgi:hypothetical protein